MTSPHHRPRRREGHALAQVFDQPTAVSRPRNGVNRRRPADLYGIDIPAETDTSHGPLPDSSLVYVKRLAEALEATDGIHVTVVAAGIAGTPELRADVGGGQVAVTCDLFCRGRFSFAWGLGAGRPLGGMLGPADEPAKAASEVLVVLTGPRPGAAV